VGGARRGNGVGSGIITTRFLGRHDRDVRCGGTGGGKPVNKPDGMQCGAGGGLEWLKGGSELLHTQGIEYKYTICI
jgi:hypothetical protein